MRGFIAIVIGYLVFGISNYVFLMMQGIHPADAPAFRLIVITILFGCLTAIVSGILTAVIAGKNYIRYGYILALLIAVIAAISMIMQTGNHWTQWLAILLLAPLALTGTVLYSKLLAWINQPKA